MKKYMIPSLLIIFCVGLALIYMACSASGKASANCKIVNGKKECGMYVELVVNFSPKPTTFDEVFVIDLNSKYKLLDQSIPINVTLKTDKGYTGKATFTLAKNKSKSVSPIKTGFTAHVFTPADKAATDKFIKNALANTIHTLNGTMTFKFTTDGVTSKATGQRTYYGKGDIGIRTKFQPEEKLYSVPLTLK
ncbi:MAG TPA: hypothetical protein ENO00_04405 [Deltaproteobacteria bacterium]|nr:hypothetical protein [Deltaproteobacteria bacterium]